MPHFGEIAALVGTLRKDGYVSRVDNSLRTDSAGPTTGNGWAWDDGTLIFWDDGTEVGY
jgi:hypothetical protein